MIEHSLKEWTQQQILTEKHTMINRMNTAIHVDSKVFQPLENANTKFMKTDRTEKPIGLITSSIYGNPTLEIFSSLHVAKQPSKAALALQTQDGLPLSLPLSLITSTISSPDNPHSVKCEVTQTRQAGKYNITFTPTNIQNQLIVQVGGVDIPDSPFTLPVIPTPGKPVK